MDEEVGLPQVTIIFGYFVFENQVISEYVSGQPIDQAVALPEIMPEMDEDNVRFN